MKHLSLLTTLLLTSSMVHAGWITTGIDYKGDCLEMMCDCVEDSETRDGYCCPDGTAFANTGNSHPTYTPCKCPENQTWDLTTNSCISSKVCTILYSNKNKINDERYKSGECCAPEQTLVNDKTNTLFEGYKTKEERYGCCLAQNVYTKPDKTTGCCNPETHTVLEITGGQACCPKDKPHWDEDSQSCLALCGPDTEFGIVLVIDRTGSMKESYTHYSETGEKEKDKRYDMVDKALSKLKVYTNAYSAVYENDKSPRTLDWGIHSKKQIENAIFKYSFGDTGGTGFNEAFGKIEKLCRGDQKFVILWLTDGEITKTPKTLKKNLKNRKCDATLYMVSPKEKHKEDYDADKWVSFEDFSEKTIEEFNEIVEEKKCYREGERNTPETIGRPSCAFGEGYFKGKCNDCNVKYAKSCDFHDLVCREGSCQKGSKCYLKPSHAFCTTADVEGGWRCEANYYKNWDKKQCIACPENSTSELGSYRKNHCKCNANYYAKSGQCLKCPANSTSEMGSTESKHCKCNANYYKKNGVCLACPYGTRSPAGSTKKSQCK